MHIARIRCRRHLPVPRVRDDRATTATEASGPSPPGRRDLHALSCSVCSRHLQGDGQDGHLHSSQLQGILVIILKWYAVLPYLAL